jgi:membrane-associated phospholipid phosphatase
MIKDLFSQNRRGQKNKTTSQYTGFTLLLFLFLLLASGGTQAQDSTQLATPVQDSIVRDTIPTTDTAAPYYYRLNGAYLKTFWPDFKHVVGGPFRWQLKDWGKAAAITGLAAGLMFTSDVAIREFMVNNQKQFFISAGRVFEPLGNNGAPLLVAGMYATSLITQNRKLEHSSLAIAKGAAISTALYVVSKQFIRRERPVRTDDPTKFGPPFSSKGYTSFPSGHTNTMFSIATGFAQEYKDYKWVPWVAYSLATLTSVTRMYQNRHWASDIVIGAAIGHFVTKSVYKQEARRRAARSIKAQPVSLAY